MLVQPTNCRTGYSHGRQTVGNTGADSPTLRRAWRRSTRTAIPPLLDRIDIHIEVPSVDFKQLRRQSPGASSAAMREQVIAARAIQTQRFTNSRVRHNAHLSTRQIRTFRQLDNACHKLLESAAGGVGLSARAHDQVLRVSRTIADLDASEQIHPPHITEAINYCMLDRQMWT
jgi:magnesium chelatase family protein